MIVDDVKEYLNDNITSLTKATNLFVGYMPDEVDDVVVVYNTGGAEPNKYIPTADPTFQVMIRNTDYVTGEELMDSITDELHQLTNQALTSGGAYFYNIMLMGEGSHIGQDESGRHEFSINFICHTRR